MKIVVNKRKLLIYVLCGLIITISLLFVRGAFNASTTKDTLRLVCDAFFLPGAMLILSGALIWSLDNGVADGITYSFKKIFDLRKRAYEEEKETYSEYKEKKHKNKGSVIEFFISGCCYLIVSTALLIIYNSL